jgi:hypothetical protein
MGTKRLFAVFFLPLLLISFLQAQSLADLAKKEKERRAALKGKHATVVTTKDLAKSTRRPAVESAAQEQAAEEVAVEAGEAGAQAGQEGAAPPAAQQAGEAAAGPEKTAAESEKPPATAQEIQKKQAELTDTAREKAEMVDLLTLKMNTLYQEFYSLDNMKSREMIQVQISDTYDKLLKAETESAKAQKDLEDFMAQTNRAQAPAIWIK